MLTEKDLATHLSEHGVPHELMDPGKPTPTCEAAADALGVRVDQLVKSILFCTDKGDRALLVLRGDVRADAKKLAEATGVKGWRLAKPHEVEDATGYPVGAVPPFLLPPRSLPVFVDPLVAQEDEVVGGGGAGHLMLRVPTKAILHLNGATVRDLTRA